MAEGVGAQLRIKPGVVDGGKQLTTGTDGCEHQALLADGFYGCLPPHMRILFGPTGVRSVNRIFTEGCVQNGVGGLQIKILAGFIFCKVIFTGKKCFSVLPTRFGFGRKWKLDLENSLLTRKPRMRF